MFPQGSGLLIVVILDYNIIKREITHNFLSHWNVNSRKCSWYISTWIF